MWSSTTPPQDYIESRLLLSSAGHKGFGIAFAIDTLCAAIVNTNFGNEIYKIYEPCHETKPGRVSHLFAAMRNDLFGTASDFLRHVNLAKNFLHKADKPKGTDNLYYPGEKEWQEKIMKNRGNSS